MVISVITSGRDKAQVFIDGYRMRQNKRDERKSLTYLKCVKEGCKATAAVNGELRDETISLKYHNCVPHVHNHPPDEMGNRVQRQLHEFRKCARETPDVPAKRSYDNLTAKNLSSLSDREKEEYLGILPPFQRIKDMHYNITKKVRPSRPKKVEDVDFNAYGNLGKTEFGKTFFR